MSATATTRPAPIGHRPRENAETIDALLARPEGATVLECCEAVHLSNVRSMLKRLQHLAAYGRAWVAKVPGRNCLRWFSSAAARDAWALANPPSPTQKQARAAKAISRPPTVLQRIMDVITERGGHGTLSADLAIALQRHIGNIGSWVTRLEQMERVDTLMYRNVRIITPAGVPLLPSALQACQRRIDRGMVKRGAGKKFTIVAAQPGLPAGVTLPARRSWADQPAVNADQVKPEVGKSPRFDRRFQVDPDTHVAGGFADMGPGRYDMGPSHAVAQWLGRRAA